MKASDYIAKRIKKETPVVFGIIGGAIVNLFDSLYKQKIKIITMHHEQACAIAADAYARVSGKLGVVISTSGPGATNLITGTCCSWFDSIPILTIAGQVPKNQLKGKSKIRQRGFQETDTVTLFKSITKFSKRVIDIKKDLENAMNIAKSERKGPVFLELCDDIQREEIKDIDTMKIKLKENINIKKSIGLKQKIENYIAKSNRPLLILGAGCKIVKHSIKEFVDKLNIATLLTWGAMDLLPDNHPLNCRDFGVTSQRIGNFAIQNSDLIICLGTRLDTHEVINKWAQNAKKIIIDIDDAELKKHKADYKTKINLKQMPFLENRKDFSSWLNKIQILRKQYPLPKTMPYEFIKTLSEYANEKDIIITDAGQTLVWTMQAWKVKENQRLLSAFNHSPMGYALPASIGAYFANHFKKQPTYKMNRNIICITGDGGLQINLQELQTIVGYKLPIKIFVIDNKGYGMIKQTQSDWKNLKDGVACEPYMTKLSKIAKAHGITYKEINSEKDFKRIPLFLKLNEPVIIKVKIPDGTKIEPKLKYGDDFDDLSPKLSKEDRRKINGILKSC